MRPPYASALERGGCDQIGRDLWPAGRLARILAGLFFLAAAAATVTAHHTGRAALPLAGEIVLAFLLAAAAYTVLFWTLGERLLARIDPWLTALALIVPLALVSLLPVTPEPVSVGISFYVAVSLLVQAVIGYGGCEIAGIPALLTRHRYTVYCALNGVDVAERWLRARPRWVTWTMTGLAFLMTMALFALALTVAQGRGFWAAYLLFLLIGFAISRARGTASR